MIGDPFGVFDGVIGERIPSCQTTCSPTLWVRGWKAPCTLPVSEEDAAAEDCSAAGAGRADWGVGRR
jgi:hypothetical protein